MATSELSYYARFDEALVGADDFADAGICRRAIGNLNHLADQFAQVRGAALFHSSVGGAEMYATTYEASPAIDTYYEVWRSTSFDMHVRSDGSSYPLVVRLRVTSNTGSYAATFRVVLSWEGADHGAEMIRADPTNVDSSVVVTSASVTWEQATNLVYLDADRVRRARRPAAAIDSVGGEERSATRLRAVLLVYAKVNNASAQARLHGAKWHEYLEP